MGDNAVAPLGYYVHHHGTGHMRRALTIIAHITQPVILYSSLPRPPKLPNHVTYVHLVSDVVQSYQQPSHSVFHYTPYSQQNLARIQQLINSWQEHGVRHMYVDVSIEVAVLAKLCGLTVGHAIMQGVRTDIAHSYGYDACDYTVAHMSQLFDKSSHRKSQTATLYSGGISRYKKQTPTPLQACQTVTVLLSPAAERSMTNELFALAKYTPDIQWHCIGVSAVSHEANIQFHGIVEDPKTLLQQADLVVGAGGNNTIMEIAALGKPFICVPEPRPYDEQVTAAKTLQQQNMAVWAHSFPTTETWGEYIAKAQKLDLQAFSSLVSDDAPVKVAEILMSAGAHNN